VSAINQEWDADSQDCTIVPYRVCEISTHCVDQDLVIIELENDIRKPPVSLPMETVPVAN